MQRQSQLAPCRHRILTAILLSFAGIAVPFTAGAQTLDSGGSANNRAAAIQAIPFSDMNEVTRNKLAPIVQKPTIYRKMPVQVIDCDPDLYLFLVRYPEVIVNIWQLMDVTNVQVQRTGPFSLNAADGAGTVSKVELVYGRPDLHIYYAEGYYEGPLFRRRIVGDCVLILKSDYTNRDGRTYVSSQLDAFVRMEHAGADILLKTLHPLMGKTADYNFVETVKFVGQVSHASEINGPGMGRLSDRLANVPPEVRSLFAKHTDVVYQRGMLRRNTQPTPTLRGNPFDGTPTAGRPANGNSAVPATNQPTPVRR
jgi:hypothetical protein